MTISMRAAAAPKAVGESPLPQAQRRHPALLALVSALGLWLAFPPAGWAWLAWVALAPLCLLIRSNASGWALFGGSWLGGFVFWLLAIRWVRLSEPGTAWLGWLVMSASLSIFWPAFVGLARLATRRFKWPLVVAVPTVWVALEYARAYFLTGFPWYYLAHSQYLYIPLIQIADLTGALGVSFLIAMANACWAELLDPAAGAWASGTLRLRRGHIAGLVTVAVGLATTLAYGGYRLTTAQFRPGPRLALLQSNIQQVYDLEKRLSEEQILAVYRGLIETLAERPEVPDLIVWPETSYPYGFVQVHPQLGPEELLRQIKRLHPDGTIAMWRDKDERVRHQLHGWTDHIGIPMMVGSVLYDFTPKGISRYNAAILFQPGQKAVQSYAKLRLVPFGEYVPLLETLPWLTILTPYRGERVPTLAHGIAPSWFELKGYRLAAAICFEDTLPDVVRRFFAEAPGGRQPDLVLNLSNDGWFQWSEELETHLASSVFRAVEHRVPLARAVNTGISALINGNGSIYAQLPKNTGQVLCGVVLLDDRTSFYSAWGDWLARLCALASALLVVGAIGESVASRVQSGRRKRLPEAAS
jgi:apolipoprotein N-acyltransferase